VFPHNPRMSHFKAPPKKSLGQHFLTDRTYIEKIVMAVNPQPGDRLVEIGPGQGAITFPLLRRHGELTAIEFDRDLITPLMEAAEGVGRLTIIHKDVLDVDFGKLAGEDRIRLVGNLPYNLSSPILFHAIEHAASIRDMVFMLQKEVVDRMAAEPGSKVYGRLSVMLQAYCRVDSLFVVPPGAFRPPPKVDSAVARLVPRAADDRHPRPPPLRGRGARRVRPAPQDPAQCAVRHLQRGADRSRRDCAPTCARNRFPSAISSVWPTSPTHPDRTQRVVVSALTCHCIH
jgi:16S rRNA (adenine1518-N6/adenine1519-N6)-dimethyltransferase